MKDIVQPLAEQYQDALRDYLGGAAEAALQRGYELGRQAVADGLGVLEVAAIHKGALERLLSGLGPAESEQVSKSAEFFAESLSPFEISLRAFKESYTALRRMNQMLEEETKRIAHAIHDDAGQLLAATHIALDEVARKLPAPYREEIKKVKTLLDDADQQLRRLSHELRPTILDDLGLIPALEFLAEGVSKRAGVTIAVSGCAEALPPMIGLALYRTGQEALTNVIRHAQATHVVIKVEQGDNRIGCSIRDNGIGFEMTAVSAKRGERGFGLIGIQERLKALGGTCTIKSAPNQGTELLVIIPLEVQDVDSNPSL
jgi:two-component system sensor histidine kinase UhpB